MPFSYSWRRRGERKSREGVSLREEVKEEEEEEDEEEVAREHKERRRESLQSIPFPRGGGGVRMSGGQGVSVVLLLDTQQLLSAGQVLALLWDASVSLQRCLWSTDTCWADPLRPHPPAWLGG